MFVDGVGDVCNACLMRVRMNPRSARNRAIFCDCGHKAVMVVWVNVGEGGIYLERMALCKQCLALEEAGTW
jgi:hypothetical protein